VAETTFVGHVKDGGSISRTVIVNEQVSVFPLESVAVHVTVFTPLANREPLGGVQLTLVPLQLSATDASKVATASQTPTCVNSSCGGGQVIIGLSRSWTITAKLHRFVLPLGSVATQLTAVTPLANVEPAGGAQTSVALQLSVALAT
jgi:hypothetical protein